jgi:hypothetical protein
MIIFVFVIPDTHFGPSLTQFLAPSLLPGNPNCSKLHPRPGHIQQTKRAPSVPAINAAISCAARVALLLSRTPYAYYVHMYTQVVYRRRDVDVLS